MKGFILKEENCVKLLWTVSHLCHSHETDLSSCFVTSWKFTLVHKLCCTALSTSAGRVTQWNFATNLISVADVCSPKIKSKYAHQIKIPVFRFYNKQTNYTGETDLLKRPLHWLKEAFRSNLMKNRQSMSLETNCCIQILFKSKDSHSLPHSCQQTAQHWWLSNVAQYLLFILHTDFADELMTDLAGCD